jgi:hypothetical protein
MEGAPSKGFSQKPGILFGNKIIRPDSTQRLPTPGPRLFKAVHVLPTVH